MFSSKTCTVYVRALLYIPHRLVLKFILFWVNNRLIWEAYAFKYLSVLYVHVLLLISVVLRVQTVAVRACPLPSRSASRLSHAHHLIDHRDNVSYFLQGASFLYYKLCIILLVYNMRVGRLPARQFGHLASCDIFLLWKGQRSLIQIVQ